MFNVPFLSNPPDDGEEISAGDKAKVLYGVPVYEGRVGICVGHDSSGGYTLRFPDGNTMTYDRDMIRKINAKK